MSDKKIKELAKEIESKLENDEKQQLDKLTKIKEKITEQYKNNSEETVSSTQFSIVDHIKLPLLIIILYVIISNKNLFDILKQYISIFKNNDTNSLPIVCLKGFILAIIVSLWVYFKVV